MGPGEVTEPRPHSLQLEPGSLPPALCPRCIPHLLPGRSRGRGALGCRTHGSRPTVGMGTQAGRACVRRGLRSREITCGPFLGCPGPTLNHSLVLSACSSERGSNPSDPSGFLVLWSPSFLSPSVRLTSGQIVVGWGGVTKIACAWHARAPGLPLTGRDFSGRQKRRDRDGG